MPQSSKSNRVVISGCSGGGKSTLLAELGARGHRVFTEPGREIVRSELTSNGDALPWTNPGRFAERCIALAIAQIEQSEGASLAFFDRSIIDAVSALEHMKLAVPDFAKRALEGRPYARRVFMAPPWPELFATNAERRHAFEDATAEFDRLVVSYRAFGYELAVIPKQPVERRADFLLQNL